MNMKHVKLFEDFNQPQNGPKTYIFYVNNEGKDTFQADVRDQDGKIIFEVTAKDLNNDGMMKTKDDIQGLRNLLISKNKMKQGDQLVPAKEYKNNSAEEFSQAFNTNG